jgi:hypothetical protein
MSNTSIQRAKAKPLDSRERHWQLRAKPVASRKPIGGRVRSKKRMPTTRSEDENQSIAQEISERDKRKSKSTPYESINEYTWQSRQDLL